MNRVWRERADPRRHADFMRSRNEGGVPVARSRDNLLEKWVYFVDVCGFTFQFENLDQVMQCKRYFECKIHSSTREVHPPYEHYWQPWYCKLPKGIRKGARRHKVLKALDKVLTKWR